MAVEDVERVYCHCEVKLGSVRSWMVILRPTAYDKLELRPNGHVHSSCNLQPALRMRPPVSMEAYCQTIGA
jgi:hypothetical protein